jgi:hypothetical protein
MNFFDDLQHTAFSIVADTMGYIATWTPSAGNTSTLTAQVLFKDPSETARALEIEYDPQRAMMEYQLGDLEGLKVSVDAKTNETIFIDNVPYGVNKIKALADGKTFRADLQII